MSTRPPDDASGGAEAELADDLRLRTPEHKRAERRTLGFLRQPSVRWLSPGLLVLEGVQVVVSGAFGRFADKREQQSDEQPIFDYSEGGPSGGGEEMWIDFLSDTGDGWEATYTMAWLLGQPELAGPDGKRLPQGELLLLGGDQVYPSAGPEPYEDRFVGPFAAAFPASDPPRGLFATPGNHDWYDGLISFLRIFCRPHSIDTKAIGGWRTRQTRSYYALRLPNRWWVWAIDIQFDTYIDNRQLDYFADAGDALEKGDNVILITAKPSWVKVEGGRFDPASWRNLAYFERTMIRERGARLVLTLTGDLHHYSRYQPETKGAGPTRITAGGGGAYLSPTHTLPPGVELRHAEDEEAVPYKRGTPYPDDRTSSRLRWGVLKLPVNTPSFGVLMGATYALLCAAILGALNAGDEGLVEAASGGGVFGFLGNAASGTPVIVFLILVGLLSGYADFRTVPAKIAAGATHAAVHAAVVAGVVYFMARPFSNGTSGSLVWLVALPTCFAAGFVVGSFIFAVYLLAVHSIRGPHSPKHANEVFAGQAIADYKNLLRLHFDRDGRLTVYPLGVERICRRWDLTEAGTGPRFAPRDEAPRAAPIDEPLRFDPPGK
ncbi:MAG TPA: metallophosphoesterase [Solirubrobacterales bacterium]|nr:metallophosphoesterase [Solirubrobacterales bacterium]